MEPLFQRLTPCGPVLDAAAAQRVRDSVLETARAEGWRDALENAWPSLSPVFAASPYLAGLVRRAPARLGRALVSDPTELVADLAREARRVGPAEGALEVEGRLRGLKSELHLVTALADLASVFDLEATTASLSAFADAAIETAFEVAAREAAAEGRITRSAAEAPAGPVAGLFCLAMGKLGGFELNYSSDIDLTIFYDPDAAPLAPGVEAQAFATRFTDRVADLLRRRTAQGYVFRVDLRLRPDPLSTPVAVSVPAALEYYETVGQNWERAAFIKARIVAGDRGSGEAFLRSLRPFIWRRNLDFAAIADIHAIKRQIHSHKVDDRVSAPGADLKLGRGGIREIEFYVQTQQLILGGRHPELRQPGTRQALRALRDAGHVSSHVAEELDGAYAQLRKLEHRIQMVDDDQTHRLPEAQADRRRVAALSGMDGLRRFDAAVGAVLKAVNRRYCELFADEEPLSSRFGNLVFTGVDDDPETLVTLRRMGFDHPAQVSRSIREWRHGRIAATRTERGREAFTRLAPRLLQAIQATGASDLAFARYSEFFCGLRSGVQVQALFLAKPKLLELVVRIMAVAPQLARTLARTPAALDSLLDPSLFDPAASGTGMGRPIADAQSFEAAMDTARRLHREAAFRIAAQVLEGVSSAEAAGRAFAELADTIIVGLSQASLAEVERKGGPPPGEVAVIALGKCGSAEMTATSDLDLMTLYRGSPGRDPDEASWPPEMFFARFTQRLVAALSAPTAEGGLYEVDLQLRPSGTKGPVAVSIPAFEAYYFGDAEVWELLAMTRARVVWATSAPFAAAASAAIEAALRRPRDVRQTLGEVRAMRDLIARERPPHGPWDMKLNSGGLVDIEFCAQALQLVNAPGAGPLRQNTLEALRELGATGAAPTPSTEALAAAFRLQQNLSQLLKIALPERADPSDEPRALRELIARAAEVKTYAAVRPKLERARARVLQVFQEVIGRAEGGRRP